MNLNKTQQAALMTIKYFDLFDYPPSDRQIQKYLFQKKASIREVDQCLSGLKEKKLVDKTGNYWYLKGREELAKKRKERKKHSQKLRKKLFYFGWLFKFAPFVRSVIITNNLAFDNASRTSDIDLLILTKKNRLWTARFFTTLITNLTGLRVMSKNGDPGKICLSFFLAEDNLNLLPIDKNYQIFRSYWIALLEPLYDHGLFGKFLTKNSWAVSNFPNFNKNWRKGPKKALSICSFLLEKFLNLFKKSEELFYNFQKKKITRPKKGSRLNKESEVVITSSVFKSHFNNHRQEVTKILEKYQVKIS
jgi:hypothetical protein